jgi:putative DNA primase/helicase
MAATPIEDALEGAALRYASNGYPVFPCHTPTPTGACSCGTPDCGSIGKHPRTANGLSDATTDAAQVAAWWKRWPDANIGLATGGAKRLVILDVDQPDAIHNLPAPLAETLTTQTGREGGGRHHWYHAPLGVSVRNTRGRLPAGIDIRGDGGYIIAPPSLHATGQRYRPADRRPIAELPGMIVALVAAAHRNDAPQRVAPREWTNQDGTAYGIAALEREAADVAATPEGGGIHGGRNEQLVRSAFSLGQLIAGGELDERAAVAALEQAAAACGLEHRSAEATITSGITAGQQEPRSAPATERPVTRVAERDYDPQPPPKQNTWPLTDLGNAERLVHYFGAHIRYCSAWNTWLVWDGTRWKRDANGAVVRYAKRTARQIFQEAADEENEDRRKALGKWADRSENHGRLNAMISLAESEPGIPIQPEHLDADPYLLNTSSGTVDLRTGELRDHDRGDLLTKIAPVAYVAAADAPFYHAFLDRVFAGDGKLVAFLNRVAGLSILGTTSERLLPICHGAGANGKSTLLELWSRVLGDYADQADADTLLLAKRQTTGNTPELADLHGKRLVVTSETSEGRRLDVARVKAITGGDTIKACRKFENPFSFTPSHTVWLATNHRPRITDDGAAIWDRVHLIPFTVTFPPDTRVPRLELDERLDQDAPGVLAWLVRGAVEYLRNGVGEIPEAVRIATDAYRSNEDVIGAFLDDMTERSLSDNTACRALFTAYSEWCDGAGERPMRERDFAPRVEAKGYEKHKTKTSNVWLNLRLKVEST